MSSFVNLLQRPIKCFQHCNRQERYLCFEIPDKCPACSISLFNSSVQFRVPPFIMPHPFTLLSSKTLPPLSILLQPTDGDYSRLINEPDVGDLHIAITSSNGDVYDYDSDGLNRNSIRWFKLPAIAIKLDQVGLELLAEEWNSLLDFYWSQKETRWSSSNYEEFDSNCLDFVLSFLFDYGFFASEDDYSHKVTGKSLLSKSQTLLNGKNYLKQKLTRDLIEPEFLKSLKYLNLIIFLNDKNYFVENL